MADAHRTVPIGIPRLLLVEDNADDAELTRRALARAHIGNELTLVTNGEQALDLLYRQALNETEEVGFILLDLGLPGMHGREVLERIWSDRRLRHIPVIVLTGSASDEDMLRSYKSGAVAFLRKPVEVDRLIHAVSELPEYRLLIARVKTSA
ncbi:response regulator [Candidatus Binatia bacterium]|nr:response regulator [Candidatus Binatia bacterium]